MLDKGSISKKLALKNTVLQELRVKSLYLFGSFLHGDYHKKSDIDFVVDYSHPISLFEHFDTRDSLQKIFKRKIDLLTRNGIHPALRDNILNEMETVYEAQA